MKEAPHCNNENFDHYDLPQYKKNVIMILSQLRIKFSCFGNKILFISFSGWKCINIRYFGMPEYINVLEHASVMKGLQ